MLHPSACPPLSEVAPVHGGAEFSAASTATRDLTEPPLNSRVRARLTAEESDGDAGDRDARDRDRARRKRDKKRKRSRKGDAAPTSSATASVSVAGTGEGEGGAAGDPSHDAVSALQPAVDLARLDADTADHVDFGITSTGAVMNAVDTDLKFEHLSDLDRLGPEPDAFDEAAFERLIAKTLDADQERRILEPSAVYGGQRSVLAVHWHPEFVDPALIRRRIDATFPNSDLELVVPTQHNVITHFGDWAGVEIDCYEPAFREKVQLLFHFAGDRVPDDNSVFNRMLRHTFEYRSRQLWEFLDSLLEPAFVDRVDEAVRETQVVPDIVEFLRIYMRRLRTLIERNMSRIPIECVRNKILRDYLDLLRDEYPDAIIDRAQVLLRAVKRIVKREFSLDYFYQAREFIEEGRALGAGIVIPHPEQFWPVLLADYDIDGIEVWNPQSYRYTQFLIEVVTQQNRRLANRDRPLLITMGDDCHMGEKVKDLRYQDKPKAAREIGVQPPWDEPRIAAMLNAAGMNRADVIREYTARLREG